MPCWDEFLTEFLVQVQQWIVGDPTSSETKLGPMASHAPRADLVAQVDDAIAKGATVHLGGEVADGRGAYYPATVLSGVDPTMRAYREELFGPVAVLYRVGSAAEAVEIANDSPFGLGAAVYGRDEATAQEVADQLEVGWWGSTPPSRAPLTCRSEASGILESAASSEGLASRSSPTRSCATAGLAVVGSVAFPGRVGRGQARTSTPTTQPIREGQ